MGDEITVGDPRFADSVRHDEHGAYLNRRGDGLLAQMERIEKTLEGPLTPQKRALIQALLDDVRVELAKCGPYYAEKAGIAPKNCEVRPNAGKMPVAVIQLGRDLLAVGPQATPRKLKS